MPDNSLMADVLLDGHCAVSIDDVYTTDRGTLSTNLSHC